MIFLIIERFIPEKVKELYELLDREGRQLPDGVKYINSWVDMDLETCYQIMEAENVGKIQEWLIRWQDFAEFEIIPVIDSTTAKGIILSR